jgi:RimJ/RimL family protein N-acetyltransferase
MALCLETARLELRPMTLGDVGSLHALMIDPAVWPRYWRLGLAAEACRAILAEAFGPLGLERVLACTDAPNFRSLALVARLGFHQIGTTPGAFGAIRWFALERG